MSHDDRQPSDPDDALQELLGIAVRQADPVPPHVVASARGAWTWRTIDEELAALVFDSATELTGVRDVRGPRQLTFQAPGVEIEVMVADPATRRLVGQVVPAQATTVRLEGTQGALEQAADRFGRFSFEPVPRGPVRLSIVGNEGTATTTDWVVL
jgi:hypothetical protein